MERLSKYKTTYLNLIKTLIHAYCNLRIYTYKYWWFHNVLRYSFDGDSTFFFRRFFKTTDAGHGIFAILNKRPKNYPKPRRTYQLRTICRRNITRVGVVRRLFYTRNAVRIKTRDYAKPVRRYSFGRELDVYRVRNIRREKEIRKIVLRNPDRSTLKQNHSV